MSKRIVSKITRWGGSVTIADPLTISQAKLIEAGMGKVPPELVGENGKYWLSVEDDMKLPALFGCVEKWELDNFPQNVTLDNFPASPRGDSHKLIDSIFAELMIVYFGEALVPNA